MNKDKKKQTILSLDIGGTFTKIAVCSQISSQAHDNEQNKNTQYTNVSKNKQGVILSQDIELYKEGKFKTDHDNTWDSLWKKVLQYCETNEIDINTVDALAISVPGFPNEANMTLNGGSPNLPNLSRDSLKKSLDEAEFHKLVYMVNDATAQLHYEHRFGVLKDASNALLITGGTGIGCGILINGEVYQGKNGGAGEIGHVALYFKGLNEYNQCSCGKMNCIEKYASVSGLLRSVNSLYHTAPEKAEDILDAYFKDNSFFSSVDLWLEALSSISGSLINIFNPEVLCFSGSIMKYKELLPILNKKIKQYSFKTLNESITLTLSCDNIFAGVKGAAVYALMKMNAI